MSKILFAFLLASVFGMTAENASAGLCETECIGGRTDLDVIGKYCSEKPGQEYRDWKKYQSEGFDFKEILEDIKNEKPRIAMYAGNQESLAYAKCMMAAVGVHKPEAKGKISDPKEDKKDNGDGRAVKNQKSIVGRELEKSIAQQQPNRSDKIIVGHEPEITFGEQPSVKDISKTDDRRAPFIAAKCVRIVQAGKGISDAYKRIYNECRVPVMVLFCLESPGAINECLNRNRYGSSDTIPSKKSQLTADAIQGPWTAWYFVCDMSDPKKYHCLVPNDMAGSAPHRE